MVLLGPLAGFLSLRKLYYWWIWFLAWWEGEDFDAAAANRKVEERFGSPSATDSDASEDDEAGENKRSKRLIPRPQDVSTRAMVCEMLWGDGHLSPGGEELHVELAKTLVPNEQKTMAMIGVGLGGPAREIAKASGVWIDGYEPRLALVNIARDQCQKAGLSRKVTIHACDYAKLSLPDARFHGVMSVCEFHCIDDKKQALGVIRESMKDDGVFILADYVAAEGEDIELRFCFDEEWTSHKLWTLEEYKAELSEAGFDVRVSDDATPNFLPVITNAWAGWRSLVEKFEQMDVDDDERSMMMRILAEEASAWAERQEQLNAGTLKIARLVGFTK